MVGRCDIQGVNSGEWERFRGAFAAAEIGAYLRHLIGARD